MSTKLIGMLVSAIGLLGTGTCLPLLGGCTFGGDWKMSCEEVGCDYVCEIGGKATLTVANVFFADEVE